jgi:hypothetical protein
MITALRTTGATLAAIAALATQPDAVSKPAETITGSYSALLAGGTLQPVDVSFTDTGMSGGKAAPFEWRFESGTVTYWLADPNGQPMGVPKTVPISPAATAVSLSDGKPTGPGPDKSVTVNGARVMDMPYAPTWEQVWFHPAPGLEEWTTVTLYGQVVNTATGAAGEVTQTSTGFNLVFS